MHEPRPPRTTVRYVALKDDHANTLRLPFYTFTVVVLSSHDFCQHDVLYALYVRLTTGQGVCIDHRKNVVRVGSQESQRRGIGIRSEGVLGHLQSTALHPGGHTVCKTSTRSLRKLAHLAYVASPSAAPTLILELACVSQPICGAVRGMSTRQS